MRYSLHVAGMPVNVAETSKPARGDVDEVIAKRTRSVMDMGRNGHGGDELDAEFERY